mmetsp:Transcript_42648/g.128874  ORF Transcript_42648/g.128874 Transcript_42648/m.128874 type:complete len:227 (-) Transcript_42648:110-790(-)
MQRHLKTVHEGQGATALERHDLGDLSRRVLLKRRNRRVWQRSLPVKPLGPLSKGMLQGAEVIIQMRAWRLPGAIVQVLVVVAVQHLRLVHALRHALLQRAVVQHHLAIDGLSGPDDDAAAPVRVSAPRALLTAAAVLLLGLLELHLAVVLDVATFCRSVPVSGLPLDAPTLGHQHVLVLDRRAGARGKAAPPDWELRAVQGPRRRAPVPTPGHGHAIADGRVRARQ